MQQCNVEHRVFAVEQFFRNNDSVVTVQRLFCRHFNVARDGAIPDRNTILCNEYKFGFKIEACLTPITRDLLTSLVG